MIAHPPQPGVLHLVSTPSPTNDLRPPIGRVMPTYLCAQAIRQGLTPPGTVLLIGDPTSERAARAIGLRPDQRIAPPLGRVSMISRLIRHHSRQCSRIVCWNDELAPLLRGLGCPADLISTRPGLAECRVSGKVDVRVFERSDRDAWESRNHQAELDSVLAPIVRDPPPLPQGPNRASLDIDPEHLRIGIVADRPRDIDARSMGFLMGLLHVSGFPLAAVMPADSSHLLSARRHHHGLGSRYRLLIAQEPIIAMLPLFDVLIHPCFDGSGGAHLIERLCENAETPVLRLRHSGRVGLSGAPGVAGPVVEALDDILARRSPDPLRHEVEIHA